MTMDVVDNRYQDVMALVEQMMVADTKEALVKNVVLLYKCVDDSFWMDDALMQHHYYPHYPQLKDSQALMMDKLIEFSYRLHKEKRLKKGIGRFMQHWISVPLLKDEVDFEVYLDSLQNQHMLANE